MGHDSTTTRLRTLARRVPVTLGLTGVLLVVGVVSQGLWTPFERSDAFSQVAYGLPAFEAGRWWTPLTGTFFVSKPWVYLAGVPALVGMGYLEHRRGSRATAAFFAIGQLFSVIAAAGVLWVGASLPWSWAQEQATVLDVGPSGGVLACVAGAVALLPSPWRLRAWTALIAVLSVTFVYYGSLPDLEHVLAVGLVLAVGRSLRPQRVSVREQRMLAFAIVCALGAIEILGYVAPMTGPFGYSAATSGSWIDVAVNTAIVLAVATALRRGRRWAWIVVLVYSALNLVLVVLLIGILILVGVMDLEGDVNVDVTSIAASSLLWVLASVYFVLVRAAFRARPRAALGDAPAPTVEEVRAELRATGGGTLSWMTTWEGMSYARFGRGIVAYQRRSGVALVLADPLGPVDARAETARAFVRGSEAAGLAPCFFSAGAHTRDAVPEGWRAIVVADDTVVDLPGLQFTGKAWGAVRTSLNRAQREGMTFRLSRWDDETWGVRQQLRAISESWVGDKGLPEMGFTLGTLHEAADPEVRLALAISPDGDVDGFLSWLPVYGEDGVRGWTLDLMRRRDGGFGPVMEYLIGSSAQQFSAEGAQVMSLSGAPLAHEYPPDAGVIADLQQRMAAMLEPVYGFASLHRFKQKFHPRYETMYLLYRDEADLTRIGAALTRAFLPHATLRQFAAAGRDLVRHER
ncbi:bifunctional lysylphosphatidylglycerol flippase/synthetase MprF [Microbacterium sp. NPDC090007]|uniref:bifunctional lysylphosphatidylglycerol flippase/synthetase MprF n=1 Tax=Microbacterium sp. NPDC090007 TaxID=3364204 RepID=UPI003823E40D